MFPTIGILGAGQLGRMTALAAIRMGLRVRFLAPKPEGSVTGLGELEVADWTDRRVLERFAAACDVVTVESEWAPCDLLEPVLPPTCALFPRPRTVITIRDKGRQKAALAAAGLPAPAFRRAATFAEAREAAHSFGFPCLLKRFRGSYDGYGNATVTNDRELEAAWTALAQEDGALVEAWAPFVNELAVLVARRADGESVTYPVAYTEQRDHRCHAVVVPADVPPDVAERARQVAQAAVEAVDGVGLTAVELFQMRNGDVLVNELAPRPHNTGHYSIDACHASQFENHVRAILGWPLGDPSLKAPCAVMVNVLGRRNGSPALDGYVDALSVPGAAVHIYGKDAVRDKRKMGHVTVTGTVRDDVRRRAEEAAGAIYL